MILRDVQAQGRILRAIASRAPEVAVIDHGLDASAIEASYSLQACIQRHGRMWRLEPPRQATTAPEVRGDVRDAVLDAYMIQRVEAMGASQLDIDDAFGGSRLGFSEPVIV